MSGKKCIKVPVVLGIGSTQQLICTEIPLCPPAFEIKDVVKRVVVTQCEVGGVVKDLKGNRIAKVIIDAVLQKNINFKTLKEECPDRKRNHHHHDDDYDDDRHKEEELAPGETRVRCGDLRHCFVRQ